MERLTIFLYHSISCIIPYLFSGYNYSFVPMRLTQSLVFQPPSNTASSQDIILADVESTHVWLETRLNSRIEAFFIDRRAPRTILFSHANAEDVSMIYGWLRGVSIRLQVNIASYSESISMTLNSQSKSYVGYTGYARSKGTPSEENAYADIDAMWLYLTKTRCIKADRIVFYSRSVSIMPHELHQLLVCLGLSVRARRYIWHKSCAGQECHLLVLYYSLQSCLYFV